MVCHNSQSAAWLSDSGLVMCFSHTPFALFLSALHFAYSDAPSKGVVPIFILTHPVLKKEQHGRT